MVKNIHRAVSNRAQWADALSFAAAQEPDPSITVFTFNAWLKEPGSCVSDYQFNAPRSGQYVLAAATDDGTGRLSYEFARSSEFRTATLTVRWRFPPNTMRGLPPGSYEASVASFIDGQMSEVGIVRFVIENRGLNSSGRPSALPESIPVGGGGDVPDTITPVPGEF